MTAILCCRDHTGWAKATHFLVKMVSQRCTDRTNFRVYLHVTFVCGSLVLIKSPKHVLQSHKSN